MQRRKRTNANVPAKGRLREMCDHLWSRAVRNDWDNRCAICGARKCESHHLVPRQHRATRYDLANGIALCATCHKFDRNISPHQNAAGFLLWLEEHHELRAEWLRANCRPKFDGTTNVAYYIATIMRLRQYVEPADVGLIAGVRFLAYLEEQD